MQRKLLEQLMGAEAMGVIQAVCPRPLARAEARRTSSSPTRKSAATSSAVSALTVWQSICQEHLTAAELFTNTKMDLGPCPTTHSQKLRDKFEMAYAKAQIAKEGETLDFSKAELDSMRAEYERNILSFVGECDRRIQAAQRRLEKTPEENNKTTSLMRDIGEIQTAYDDAMAEVEKLGSAGKVDESMAELAKAETLKTEKMDKERELTALTDAQSSTGQSKLRVCDICGAYLSILDSDRRLADHFGGKVRLLRHRADLCGAGTCACAASIYTCAEG